MRTFILLFWFFVLTSCANKNTSTSENEINLEGEFELTDLKGVDISEKNFNFEFHPEKQRLTGETGCNGFSTDYIQEGRVISLQPPLSTRKYCEGKMKTEQEILSSLEQVAKFERNGKDFVFYSTDDKTLFTLTKIEKSE